MSNFTRDIVLLGPSKHGGLQAAEAEVELIPLHLREGEFNTLGITERGEFVDDRTPRIAVTEKLRHLVVGFARCIVPGFSQQTVFAEFSYFEEMCVAAAHHQSQGREQNTWMF